MVGDRVNAARLRWLECGIVAGATIGGAGWAFRALTGRPGNPMLVAVAAAVPALLAIVAACRPRALPYADRTLAHTITVAGSALVVTVAYALTIVGFGGRPEAIEHTVLARSIAAAAVAAVLAVATRRRIQTFANQHVHGARIGPEESLRTFAARMTRAITMDELLLQLAESLRKTMSLQAAEVWTGSDGVFERVVSVPDRPRTRLRVDGEARTVATRGHTTGNAWLSMWIPALLAGREHLDVRATSVVYLGELLGFIVVERDAGTASIRDEAEEQVLIDIARQLGLALHNARLDSALQASLVELRRRNDELVTSRARIVAAADESRRRIERNLHDGAQQHLVALAVKIGLIRQLFDRDRGAASDMIDDLREDVHVTLVKVRELAHGIYPPLLRDRGLAAALQTAANRSTLPTTVDVPGTDRYHRDVEAAVYFCCLEAMQNADKHAGAGARVRVAVHATDDVLAFEVCDDGAGFDPAGAVEGNGFVNMRDRIGAFGGTLEVVSTGGTTAATGTTVTGRIPVTS
jgi:signal transduction histidine kinase